PALRIRLPAPSVGRAGRRGSAARAPRRRAVGHARRAVPGGLADSARAAFRTHRSRKRRRLREPEKAPSWVQGAECGRILASEYGMTNTDMLHPLTRRLTAGTPEECLMAAVLEDAMDVYRHPSAKRRHLLRETEEWFRSDDR